MSKAAWLVAERGGEGRRAYGNHFRPRRAYRFCLADSITSPIPHADWAWANCWAELIEQCEALGARQMLACR